MFYRRHPLRTRRYLSSDNSFASNDSIGNLDSKEEVKIPLPNETEAAHDLPADSRYKGPLSILNRIGMEEIILIGLIFVLLHEGVEDEFLLLMLVYVLLAI